MRFFNFSVFCFLVLSMNISMAAEYVCSNATDNVQLQITLTGTNSANIEVTSPVQRLLICSVSDFHKGQETAKGFACGNDEDFPELVVIHQGTMKGFMELKDQPHYDLDCTQVKTPDQAASRAL